MPVIIGIDPGSRITGYGVIETDRDRAIYIASGCIRTKSKDFPVRLKEIFQGVQTVVKEYSPDEFAIEQVFMSKNADSALKLGHARGAAICAVALTDMPVFEYSARQVKQAVVGKGAADKGQVQHMVKILLNLHGQLQEDAGDALGVALCHAHHQQTASRLGLDGRLSGR
ncbi:MAG: crossover junction endodeoxyribonuclease RuvC [Gammaproteobacteria bacterium]|nr:MAG: crossover junction endodeoxyribonuclease RuvC [Gammaproteobacteria bacterium]